MKHILMASVFLSSMSAFAAVTSFNCELQKFPGEKVTFKIENLGTEKMQVLSIDKNDDYSGIFSSISKNETITRLVDTINGQGGDMRVKADRISFFGDGDGIDFAYFDLFKNTGYKQGFARINFDFSNDQSYSKVSCTTTKSN